MAQEYPKVIRVGTMLVTVATAEEEARWLTPVGEIPPSQPSAADVPVPDAPVEDVAAEDDEDHTAPADETEKKTRLVKKPATHKGGKKK